MIDCIEIKHYKVTSILDATVPNAVFYVKAQNSNVVKTYITTVDGIPIPLQDLAGSGGSGIITLTSTDGSVTITGTSSTKNLQVSSALQAIINSALQSGDNISTLFNDAGYISGAGTTNKIVKYTSPTTTGDSIMYEENGKIGINTLNPISQLTIVDQTTENYRGLAISQHTTDKAGAVLGLRKSRGTEAAPLSVQADDYTFGITAYNYDGIDYRVNGAFGYHVDNVIGTDNIQGSWWWSNQVNSVTDPYILGIVKMVLNHLGNLGIGTTTPTEKLHVVGNAKVTGKLNLGLPATGLTTDKILVRDASTGDVKQVDYPEGVGGGATNLAYVANPSNGVVSSDTGTDATLPLVDATNAGLQSPADYTKLNGIEALAEVNNISDVDATDLTDGGDTTLHNHDSRYYTETETDGLLDTKANLSDIPTINENVVEILESSPDDEFAFAHASTVIDNKIIIGTREAATSKLLRYNGIVLEESVTIPCETGIECFAVKSDESRIYFSYKLSGVNYLVDVDPLDFTDINQHVITGLNFFGSPAIVTDDIYIYGVEYDSSPLFFKIRISDWVVVDTNTWTNGNLGHGGAINIDDGWAVFTSSNSYLAKVALADLTYTELDLSSYAEVLTDDLAFIQNVNNDALINICVVGGEVRTDESGKGGILIDLDAMTVYPFDLLPTFGLSVSPDYSTIYSTSSAGFIEVYDVYNMINFFIYGSNSNRLERNTFTYKGNGSPNEVPITDSGIYMTNWDTVNNTGVLSKIELTPVQKPLITEEEAYYRNLGAQSYDTDLAAISALSPANDDILQRKAGVWTNRTMVQLASDLGGTGITFNNAQRIAFLTI